MITAVMAALLALGAPPSFALRASAGRQDEKYKPEQGQEKDLTPEEAMRLLKEAQELMLKTEELLNDSSRGKALETEAELLKRIEELLKDDPKAAQQKILELIRRMLQKTEKKQEDTIKKLDEIIRRAKSSSSSSSSQQDPKDRKPKDGQQSNKPKNGQNPADKPYDPNRTDPPSKFRSEADRTGSWGDLPARMREDIMNGRRDIDDYPAEYQEMIKEYMKELQQGRDK